MIRTKASIAKEKQVEKEFKVVKFEGLKRLPKTRPPTQKNDRKEMNSEDEEFEAIFGDGPRRSKPRKDKNEVTFDRARREVLNFGISGSHSQAEKADQITQLLVKLGAKPAKNKSRNYKEILEEKRKKKEEDDKVNRRTLFGTSASLQIQKRKFKNGGGLLKSYGKLDKESLKQIKAKNSAKRKR